MAFLQRREERSSGIAQTTAEILELIAQLSRRLPVSSSPLSSGQHRAKHLTSSNLESKEPSWSDADITLASLMHMVRGLESRLTRIEDALVERAKGPERAAKDATFRGEIRGQMLSDMLQLVSSNQMTGIFVIENETTRCQLSFDAGRICHARSGDVSGEEAFFVGFALGSGTYRFTQTNEPPPERTITAGTQYLVLEALRRMDESQF